MKKQRALDRAHCFGFFLNSLITMITNNAHIITSPNVAINATPPDNTVIAANIVNPANMMHNIVNSTIPKLPP